MADARDDAALKAIETALAAYPAPTFTERLRRSLERSIRMVSDGSLGAVIPYVMTQDIEPVIAFAKDVFGATEIVRATGGAGGVHCELAIGSSVVMMGGAVPGEPVKPRLLGLHVYVDDADAVYRRAIDAGARSLGEPADRPYGERAGFVADPAGNHWYIATRTGPTYFATEPRTVTPHLYIQRTPERGAPEFLAFVQAAFDATIDLLQATPEGLVAHAVFRVHGEPIELGEGRDPAFAAPAALVVYVNDCDTAYQQALEAGAGSRFAPSEQQFGGRMGGVVDAWGNDWYLATR